MPRVLILLSETGPWGAVRAARRAAELLPERFEVQLLDVRKGWRNWWPTRRRVIEAKADLVHAVGPQAFQAFQDVDVATPWRKKRFMMSACDEWIIRTDEQSLASYPLPPLVELLPEPASAPHLPARFLLVAGGFDHTANLKTAVWAFDVLKYAEPDLHLVLLGDGPQRSDLERLARKLGHDDYRVHFVGWQDDVAPYLRRAAAVWVTHRFGGTTFALEAMAGGVPVVALETDFTNGIIRDGENGLLVPFGDPVRLAAVTRELLANTSLRGRIGYAGRAAARPYTTAALGEAMTAVYDRLTRSVDRRMGKSE
jgi:glycosyltransferase involved in cell wall biosynthesis